MKNAILLAFILIGNVLHAQTTEFGLGVGMSTNASPTDNMVYQGDQMLINYSATLKFLYTSKTNWQFGIDGHILELSSKSSKEYDGYHNVELYIPSVGGDDKKLVYAKYAPAVCAVVNKKMITSPTSAFYVGVAVGYGFGRNDSKSFQPNESYKGPDGGEGNVYGMQLGYLTDISENIMFNIDVAMRYYSLSYAAEAPQRPYHELLQYSVIAIPVTIGFRYTLYHGDERKKLKGTYDVRRNKYY